MIEFLKKININSLKMRLLTNRNKFKKSKINLRKWLELNKKMRILEM